MIVNYIKEIKNQLADALSRLNPEFYNKPTNQKLAVTVLPMRPYLYNH